MDGLIYGVADHNNRHHDVSSTEKGAKISATRKGYTIVTARHMYHYHAYWVAEKVNGKWLPIERTKGTWGRPAKIKLKGKHLWTEDAKQRYEHCN